ncbi:hypothetical protein AHF37_01087 [Paragonimus kellicotti]|nr:hypothetical protein AHF37_01087 [Paragonimus kellicotti]
MPTSLILTASSSNHLQRLQTSSAMQVLRDQICRLLGSFLSKISSQTDIGSPCTLALSRQLGNLLFATLRVEYKPQLPTAEQYRAYFSQPVTNVIQSSVKRLTDQIVRVSHDHEPEVDLLVTYTEQFCSLIYHLAAVDPGRIVAEQEQYNLISLLMDTFSALEHHLPMRTNLNEPLNPVWIDRVGLTAPVCSSHTESGSIGYTVNVRNFILSVVYGLYTLLISRLMPAETEMIEDLLMSVNLDGREQQHLSSVLINLLTHENLAQLGPDCQLSSEPFFLAEWLEWSPEALTLGAAATESDGEEKQAETTTIEPAVEVDDNQCKPKSTSKSTARPTPPLLRNAHTGVLGGGGVSLYYASSLGLLLHAYQSGHSVASAIHLPGVGEQPTTGAHRLRITHSFLLSTGSRRQSGEKPSTLKTHRSTFFGLPSVGNLVTSLLFAARGAVDPNNLSGSRLSESHVVGADRNSIVLPDVGPVLRWSEVMGGHPGLVSAVSSDQLIFKGSAVLTTQHKPLLLAIEPDQVWVQSVDSRVLPTTVYKTGSVVPAKSSTAVSSASAPSGSQLQRSKSASDGARYLLQLYNRDQLRRRLLTVDSPVTGAGSFVNSCTPVVSSSDTGSSGSQLSKRNIAFVIEIHNRYASETVIIGVRICLPAATGEYATRWPKFFKVFNRIIPITTPDPGAPSRMVDIPLYRSESMFCTKMLQVFVGSSSDPEGLTSVDTISVYTAPLVEVNSIRRDAYIRQLSSTSVGQVFSHLDPSDCFIGQRRISAGGSSDAHCSVTPGRNKKSVPRFLNVYASLGAGKQSTDVGPSALELLSSIGAGTSELLSPFQPFSVCVRDLPKVCTASVNFDISSIAVNPVSPAIFAVCGAWVKDLPFVGPRRPSNRLFRESSTPSILPAILDSTTCWGSGQDAEHLLNAIRLGRQLINSEQIGSSFYSQAADEDEIAVGVEDLEAELRQLQDATSDPGEELENVDDQEDLEGDHVQAEEEVEDTDDQEGQEEEGDVEDREEDEESELNEDDNDLSEEVVNSALSGQMAAFLAQLIAEVEQHNSGEPSMLSELQWPISSGIFDQLQDRQRRQQAAPTSQADDAPVPSSAHQPPMESLSSDEIDETAQIPGVDEQAIIPSTRSGRATLLNYALQLSLRDQGGAGVDGVQSNESRSSATQSAVVENPTDALDTHQDDVRNFTSAVSTAPAPQASEVPLESTVTDEVETGVTSIQTKEPSVLETLSDSDDSPQSHILSQSHSMDSIPIISDLTSDVHCSDSSSLDTVPWSKRANSRRRCPRQSQSSLLFALCIARHLSNKWDQIVTQASLVEYINPSVGVQRLIPSLQLLVTLVRTLHANVFHLHSKLGALPVGLDSSREAKLRRWLSVVRGTLKDLVHAFISSLPSPAVAIYSRFAPKSSPSDIDLHANLLQSQINHMANCHRSVAFELTVMQLNLVYELFSSMPHSLYPAVDPFSSVSSMSLLSIFLSDSDEGPGDVKSVVGTNTLQTNELIDQTVDFCLNLLEVLHLRIQTVTNPVEATQDLSPKSCTLPTTANNPHAAGLLQASLLGTGSTQGLLAPSVATCLLSWSPLIEAQFALDHIANPLQEVAWLGMQVSLRLPRLLLLLLHCMGSGHRDRQRRVSAHRKSSLIPADRESRWCSVLYDYLEVLTDKDRLNLQLERSHAGGRCLLPGFFVQSYPRVHEIVGRFERLIRGLLIRIVGAKHYRQLHDIHRLAHLMHRVRDICSSTGEFLPSFSRVTADATNSSPVPVDTRQSPSTAFSSLPQNLEPFVHQLRLPYVAQREILQIISSCLNIATDRTSYWQRFCLRCPVTSHTTVVSSSIIGANANDSQSANIAVECVPPGSSSTRLALSMAQHLLPMGSENADNCSAQPAVSPMFLQFVRVFLCHCPDVGIRNTTAHIVREIYRPCYSTVEPLHDREDRECACNRIVALSKELAKNAQLLARPLEVEVAQCLNDLVTMDAATTGSVTGAAWSGGGQSTTMLTKSKFFGPNMAALKSSPTADAKFLLAAASSAVSSLGSVHSGITRLAACVSEARAISLDAAAITRRLWAARQAVLQFDSAQQQIASAAETRAVSGSSTTVMSGQQSNLVCWPDYEELDALFCESLPSSSQLRLLDLLPLIWPDLPTFAPHSAQFVQLTIELLVDHPEWNGRLNLLEHITRLMLRRLDALKRHPRRILYATLMHLIQPQRGLGSQQPGSSAASTTPASDAQTIPRRPPEPPVAPRLANDISLSRSWSGLASLRQTISGQAATTSIPSTVPNVSVSTITTTSNGCADQVPQSSTTASCFDVESSSAPLTNLGFVFELEPCLMCHAKAIDDPFYVILRWDSDSGGSRVPIQVAMMTLHSHYGKFVDRLKQAMGQQQQQLIQRHALSTAPSTVTATTSSAAAAGGSGGVATQLTMNTNHAMPTTSTVTASSTSNSSTVGQSSCTMPIVPVKLDVRATSSVHVFDLDAVYLISQLTVKFNILYKRQRYVRTLNVYTSDLIDRSASRLVHEPWMWQKVATVRLAPGQEAVRVCFSHPAPTPTWLGASQANYATDERFNADQLFSINSHYQGLAIRASRLIFEYADFHSTDSEANRDCPRCHTTDLLGIICPACHTNVNECTRCRSIDLSEGDVYLCANCGSSRNGKIEFSICARPCYSTVEPLHDREDRECACNRIVALSKELAKNAQLLARPLEVEVAQCLNDLVTMDAATTGSVTGAAWSGGGQSTTMLTKSKFFGPNMAALKSSPTADAKFLLAAASSAVSSLGSVHSGITRLAACVSEARAISLDAAAITRRLWAARQAVLQFDSAQQQIASAAETRAVSGSSTTVMSGQQSNLVSSSISGCYSCLINTVHQCGRVLLGVAEHTPIRTILDANSEQHWLFLDPSESDRTRVGIQSPPGSTIIRDLITSLVESGLSVCPHKPFKADLRCLIIQLTRDCPALITYLGKLLVDRLTQTALAQGDQGYLLGPLVFSDMALLQASVESILPTQFLSPNTSTIGNDIPGRAQPMDQRATFWECRLRPLFKLLVELNRPGRFPIERGTQLDRCQGPPLPVVQNILIPLVDLLESLVTQGNSMATPPATPLVSQRQSRLQSQHGSVDPPNSMTTTNDGSGENQLLSASSTHTFVPLLTTVPYMDFSAWLHAQPCASFLAWRDRIVTLQLLGRLRHRMAVLAATNNSNAAADTHGTMDVARKQVLVAKFAIRWRTIVSDMQWARRWGLTLPPRIGALEFRATSLQTSVEPIPSSSWIVSVMFSPPDTTARCIHSCMDLLYALSAAPITARRRCATSSAAQKPRNPISLTALHGKRRRLVLRFLVESCLPRLDALAAYRGAAITPSALISSTDVRGLSNVFNAGDAFVIKLCKLAIGPDTSRLGSETNSKTGGSTEENKLEWIHPPMVSFLLSKANILNHLGTLVDRMLLQMRKLETMTVRHWDELLAASLSSVSGTGGLHGGTPGYTLALVAELLRILEPLKQLPRRHQYKLLQILLHACVRLRQLVLQRTECTLRAQGLFSSMLDQLIGVSVSQIREFLTTTLNVLAEYPISDHQSAVYLLKRMCTPICPLDADQTVFHVSLEVWRGHEDYLLTRSRMELLR